MNACVCGGRGRALNISMLLLKKEKFRALYPLVF